jgi:hypothetical protein
LRVLTGSDRYDLSHPSETEYLMLNTAVVHRCQYEICIL